MAPTEAETQGEPTGRMFGKDRDNDIRAKKFTLHGIEKAGDSDDALATSSARSANNKGKSGWGRLIRMSTKKAKPNRYSGMIASATTTNKPVPKSTPFNESLVDIAKADTEELRRSSNRKVTNTLAIKKKLPDADLPPVPTKKSGAKSRPTFIPKKIDP